MIDPQKPDFANTPVAAGRPGFDYAPASADPRPYATIVTPFFNTGAVFHESARSVFRQSFQQWEWLIVNDGSTDPAALAVLEDYRKRDPRVRVIDHADNKGPSAARNTGYRAAQTDYVLQLDSDDLLEPTALEKSIWFLESHPEFAFTKGRSVGFGAQEYLWPRGFDDRDAFLNENLATSTATIRRAVHTQAGGFDESIRRGMEDWDFWLRCANVGCWGADIPEYLDWYRRRDNRDRNWSFAADAGQLNEFRAELRRRYRGLYQGSFPDIRREDDEPYDAIRTDLPFENPLAKHKPRTLLVLPWLTVGGADKFNRDLTAQLIGRGWEVTIATTLEAGQPWLPEFARLTPDIFVMPHFLKRRDMPPFLRYLIASRQPDVVMVSNSELGYLLLPYLRAHCPEPAYVDYCHMEEEYWKNGGFPRYAAARQDELDLNIVASEHLKRWMVARGADASRVEVARIHVDPRHWTPDRESRKAVRKRYGIGADTPVVLYVGRLCPQKKPKVFGRVMRDLKRGGADFRALVVGDGPDLPWLESFVAGNGLTGHVRLLGAMGSDAVRDLLSAADIFFLPSLWEGIALSIYEAMAMGLAVVGADVGGQRELVTPECGFLISPGEDEDEVCRYAALLKELLDHPERAREIGSRARERIVAHFPLERMGDRMVELFALARKHHAEAPRPRVSERIALENAALGVEYTRAMAQIEREWNEAQTRAARGFPLMQGRAIVRRARRLVGRTLRRAGLLRETGG